MLKLLIASSLYLTIIGCSSTKENKNELDEEKIEQEEIVEQNPDIYRKKFEEGIDLIARGNEPFWYLEIDFEKAMRFTSLTDISELNTPPVEGVRSEDADVTLYHSITEAGELSVIVRAMDCQDNMSGEQFTHTVKVQAKRSVDSVFAEFTGCGKYLKDD